MALANNALATRTNYLRGVRHLMMDQGKLPEECTVNEIKAFLVKIRNEAQLSSSSLNLRVCGLKYYFRHVVKRLDLVVSIPNPRISKIETEILDQAELQRLFDACRDMRQLLIVQLLFDTGLRSRELLRLQFKDFDKHNRTITVRGKGEKIRVVPYGEQLRLTLKGYVKMLGYFPKENIIESYKEKGNPLSARGLQHIVKEIAKRSGIKKRIHCHVLRHSYAVHFLNNGGHLTQLQNFLGHSHVSTTLHYLKYAHLPLNQITTPLDCMLNKD